MTQVSYGTITITDTNDIESIVVEYARNQSTSSPPDPETGGWSTTRPAWAQGYYIWQRTRIHKSGTQASADTFGAAVCLTGSTGQTGGTGAAGRSLTGTTTQYTTAASNVTITQNNMGSYTWSNNVPAYSSSTPAYWVRVTNTYSNPSSTEYIIYKDQGLTDAVKTSYDANTAAQAASDKADDAWDKADNAEDIAQQASDDVGALTTTYNTFINTKAKYFVHNSSGSIVIASREGESSPVAFDENTVSTYGYNTLNAPSYIALRYNSTELAKLSTGALIFYKPNTTNKGMELTSTALTFYNPSTNNAQLIIGANGVLQSGNFVYTSGTYSDSGTKIDLTNGSIYTPGFRTDGSNTYIRGEINALTGKIGNNSTNYWTIGNYYNYDQTASAALISHGTAFIQLDESNTWRLSTDRIHTAWNGTDGSAALVFPKDGNTYWDWGMHSPHKTNNTWKDKFIYARKYTNTSDSDFTNRDNLSNDLDDDLGYWTYQFYVDKNGSIYARNFYLLNEDGTPGSNIGGQDAVYLLKSGGTISGNLEVNGTLTKGNKNVAYLSTTPTSGQVLVADGTVGGIKTSGYTIAKSVPSNAIFTDENVNTSQANTTQIYLTGTSTAGSSTGKLKFDSNVYLTTTAGVLHATTFEGNLSGTASRATADGDGNTIKTTYLKLSGGNVTGAVTFGSSVSADELTVGDLVVNGVASFTNNLQANTINGVVVGSNPKFTDTVTTVTVTGNGNAVTAITASNGKLTVTKGTTFLTSYTETDPIFVASAAHGITSSDISNWNSKTSNTGTVTSVKVEGSNGLTGSGTVTTSGTITLSHADTSSQASSSNSGRTYIQSVTLDSYGHVTGLSTATETVTDTHYTANLITGASATAKANAAATNGNVYLNLVENNTVRNAHKITGSGTTTVTSDADGNITISSADSKVGTVTSITLTQGTGITIGDSGTAITTSGSRTISLADNYGDTKNPYASKTARYVLAAPANAAGAPSFRALTGADVGLGNVLNAAQVTGIGQGADGKIRVYKGDSNYEDVAVEIVATESSSVASAQKLTSYGGSTKQPVYFPNSGTNAGKPVAIGYTIETSVPSGAVFTDTTYTFANGTNGFTVTPLNGTAQTVTVTPSIANNITGSGTSGYLAKFNGANTITNGPALGTDTTKFLNNKGEWATPGGTYSLPLAANGTRGGVQIGYSANGKNYPVQLSSEKMYVNVPWTDTNNYHKTGSWNGLTYTAAKVGNPDDLAFTLPTASTTVSGVINTSAQELAGLKTGMFAAAHFNTSAGNSNGYYKIKINSTTSWMLNFTIRVYQSYNWYDIVVSGYNYPSSSSNYSWYSPAAYLEGSSVNSINVYFGKDNNNDLWVAIPDGNYTGLGIFNVVNGYTKVIDNASLFTITRVTSLSGTTTNTITAYRPWLRNETVTNATNASAVPWSGVSSKPNLVNTITTTAGTHSAISSATGTVSFNVPTKTSHLTNDSGFVTSSGVTSITPGNGLINGTSGISQAAITSTGTISLATVTRTNNTSTASPAHSGTFTTIDSITTDSYGRVTAVNTKTVTLPASGNTDHYVSQSVSTTSDWRKILLSYQNDSSATAAVASNTNVVYEAVGVSAQPSTGYLRAGGYNVLDKVMMKYDSTLDALVFQFS